MAQSSGFNRIYQILNEITGVKTAKADTALRDESSLKDYSPGQQSNEVSKMLKDYYPAAVTDLGETGSLPRGEAQPATTDVAFPLEGNPASTKEIKDVDLNPKDYRRKAASLTDDDLLYNVAALAQELMQDLNQPAAKTASAPPAQQHESQQQKEASSEDVDILDTAMDAVQLVQSQAKLDADLVGTYLTLRALKKVAEVLPEPEEGSAVSDSPTPKGNGESVEEPKGKKKPVEEDDKDKEPESSDSEPEEDKDKSEDTSDKDTAPAEPSDDMTSDDALQALDAMQGPANEDEILQSLGDALAELGMGPEQLAKAGSAGKKLAERYVAFHKQGKYQPGKSRKRAAVDYIKGYITDIMVRNQL